jgi:2-methylisocitrate lyase-like PEP mutase family enzyme
VRFVGERLEPPLMQLLRPGGLASLGMSLGDLHALGYRVLVDTATPLLAAFEAMQTVYKELADGFAVTSRPPTDWARLQDEQHTAIGLDDLLAVERRTVEPGD